MSKNSELKKVYAVTDESGHWYVIPFELKDQFFKDDENGEVDEWESFNEKYSHYMTGGDLNLIQLYADLNN